MTDEDYFDVDPIVGGARWRPVTRSSRMVDPMEAIPPVSRHHDADDRRARDRHRTRRSFPGVRSTGDLTELHGIPEESLTGSIRDAVLDLIDEIGHLHDQLLIADERNEFLEHKSRTDRLGEWLSTEALLGQIRHLSDLDEREGTASSLAGLNITAWRQIGESLGWLEAEAAVKTVGEILVDAAPSGDVVGRLWDGAFGILLPGLDVPEAERLVGALADQCKNRRIDCHGVALVLSVSTKVVRIDPAVEPDLTVSRLHAAMAD